MLIPIVVGTIFCVTNVNLDKIEVTAMYTYLIILYNIWGHKYNAKFNHIIENK